MGGRSASEPLIDLEGAVDLHVHSSPDVYPRSLNDLEVVRAAEAAGMKAILLKSHHTLTADRAAIAQQHTQVSVGGGLALNLTVGGFNPVAVETALAFGAKQIWMPTIHARNCLQHATPEMFQAEANKGYIGLAAFDQDGALVGGLETILELIRDAGAILGTGHLAPTESLRLIRTARRMNLQRVLVTHPVMSFTRFDRSQMEAAVSLGAFLEFDALCCRSNWPEFTPVETAAEAIAAIGARHCVLASDGGQANNDIAPKMLLEFAQGLNSAGIDVASLRVMMCENPSQLLDL
jgi:Family of unknown function (DUF6282)